MTEQSYLPSLVSIDAINDLCGYAAESPPGCFVEFGVYKGGTASYLAQIARMQGRSLFLYDTFCGMPFQGDMDKHAVNDFADTSLEAVKKVIPDAIFCVGTFPESVVPMPPIAFAHIDADQYQSIKDAIRIFVPLMVTGGIMVFDDYNCLESANQAIHEWEYELGYHIAKTEFRKGLWVKP